MTELQAGVEGTQSVARGEGGRRWETGEISRGLPQTAWRDRLRILDRFLTGHREPPALGKEGCGWGNTGGWRIREHILSGGYDVSTSQYPSPQIRMLLSGVSMLKDTTHRVLRGTCQVNASSYNKVAKYAMSSLRPRGRTRSENLPNTKMY